MSHWAAALIGRPYAAGAEGPEEFDCWGLFRSVQRDFFGRHVPAMPEVERLDLMACARAIRDSGERANWLPVEIPREGDAVLMARASHPSHVGVWIDTDGGGVLHCVQGAGVLFSSLAALRRDGWGGVRFYRAMY